MVAVFMLYKSFGNAGLFRRDSRSPHCSEAWDAISRYIYAGLQGGSIMRGWMNDEKVMIACCSDGTRPVIFKIERLDYKVLYTEGTGQEDCQNSVRQALERIDGVTEVAFRGKSNTRAVCHQTECQ